MVLTGITAVIGVLGGLITWKFGGGTTNGLLATLFASVTTLFAKPTPKSA